jgi:hypothetical protein
MQLFNIMFLFFPKALCLVVYNSHLPTVALPEGFPPQQTLYVPFIVTRSLFPGEVCKVLGDNYCLCLLLRGYSMQGTLVFAF